MNRRKIGESRRTKRTVAVDFDGVIHSYVSGWQGLVPTDPPREGALEFVEQLQALDYIVVVHTARANDPQGLAATIHWLANYSFPEMTVTANKPMAIAYIDDRAIYAGPRVAFEDVLYELNVLVEEKQADFSPKYVAHNAETQTRPEDL